MRIELASPVEDYNSTSILLLIGFNPYNFYMLFFGTLMYGHISICTNLDNQVGAFVHILVFVWFLVAH